MGGICGRGWHRLFPPPYACDRCIILDQACIIIAITIAIDIPAMGAIRILVTGTSIAIVYIQRLQLMWIVQWADHGPGRSRSQAPALACVITVKWLTRKCIHATTTTTTTTKNRSALVLLVERWAGVAHIRPDTTVTLIDDTRPIRRQVSEFDLIGHGTGLLHARGQGHGTCRSDLQGTDQSQRMTMFASEGGWKILSTYS
jgi:hypothetical protein